MEEDRLSWPQYFMSLAKVVAQRGTCPRLKVGSVIVKDKHIISTGYNGVSSGGKHCIESGCYIEDGHCKKAIHSEVNAVMSAGDRCRYSTIYVTHNPCLNCMNVLINAGVKHIIYGELYKVVSYQDILGHSNNTMPDITQLYVDIPDESIARE